ncbi:MAG: hypothetical protein LBU16_08010, partial [Treponema sp.]|nr:hypothetical protein [Treponema sp.]
MARAKHCVATALLALQFLQSGPALFARDVSGDTAYESDLEYILTNYYILGNYEEVIRLLNKHHSGCQRELAYLYGLCYLESVHNVDTLWTDFLKNRIFAAFRRENARSVHKVTDFV